MNVRYEIRKNTYYDSVTLMLISKEISKLDGVEEAMVGMGTELNKELAFGLGISNEEIKAVSPNDFFVSASVLNEETWQQAVVRLDELLSKKSSSQETAYRPRTLRIALEQMPLANLALISVPGQYVAQEARQALENGLHVMVFSDNVSIEDEKQLKQLAYEKGLLMMGPDCGTAIINHVPLAFANVVRRGDIGIVGASGTGTQEVSVLIDRLGCGVSQVIGTGGRDLKSEIGGLTMLTGLDALANDPETKVIVLISKPPSEEVSKKILEKATTAGKPVVVDFIGGDPELIRSYGLVPSLTLEDCARKAVNLSTGKPPEDFEGFSWSAEKIDEMVQGQIDRLDDRQRYLRGLYTGGTLTDEAMKMLGDEFGGIYSNIPLDPAYALKDSSRSMDHTCIDLGDDEFTHGRPHPMIDPSTRIDRLLLEAQDQSVAVILMDFVLGTGSHPDPVGEMIPAIDKAQKMAGERGQHLIMVGSVCGTPEDPQDLEESQKALEDRGVIVMPSNAQAVRLVRRLLEEIDGRDER